MRAKPLRSVQRPMSTSNPYLRTLVVGAGWFAAVGLKMVSGYSGHWTTYPPRNFIVLVFGWLLTALLLGLVATRFEKLRAWWCIGLGTMLGSLLVLGLMLFIAERVSATPTPPQFKSTDEMMAYFAAQATQWVRKDRGIDLDYSVDSIKVVEEQLGCVANEVDKTNPQRGTFGIAMGYGAYIGEVLRRREGGSWAVDHPVGGPHSYPLTLSSNGTAFPVGWCWKRLTAGEEDNVYFKARLVSESAGSLTNVTGLR